MSNTGITVRPAVKDDCLAMLELIRELAIFERAPEEVTVTLQHFEASGFGSNPVWWAWVVVDDQAQVIGFALYYIRYSTWKGQRMYLEDLIVTEAWRGRGAGTLLMNALIETAKAKGLHGISWQVLDWNTPAIDFYKKYQARFDEEWVNVSITF